MLSTWPSLVLIVLTLSDIFGACYGIPFGRFYLPLRDEGGDVLIDTYTIERVENTYELLGLFSKRLNLATEIISLSEELDNGVDAKLRLSAYDDDDDDQVDEDDDGTYKALDDYHHHTSKQFMAHLRNFLRKSSKHGISFNDTADLLSHIFASPWSVDDHGMPLCLSDCIVRAKHQQTSPSPPYTTVHPIVQMIGHPPREDHHNHQDHTDYQQVEIFFYCSNACKNALLGRGMELLGK
ncbi:unnamed protein product [Mytilus coruscus]|uniref:Uncharacterized protein n=1 Tax=Mytilus coruscus TaxID=42192 RepID=A0A6J8ANS6_MYTCO|nr:unnamed protein product [Mytilus coruscus]